MKQFLLLFALLLTGFLSAQTPAEEEITVNPLIKGTLFTPSKMTGNILVIIIAGSGPTNRSGNQVGAANNSLRYLAQDIANNGNAAFSYDKRIIAQMIAGTVDESTLRFEDFINDAKEVIRYFKGQHKYKKIIVAGHSEGSLIGMIAANGNADGFISISGAGRPADEILFEQLNTKFPKLKEELQTTLDKVKKGETYTPKSPIIASVFRESVQPYLKSWIQYNPQKEISKLSIPVLILNGDKDLQVPPSDAKLLQKAKPDARLYIVSNMNHVLKEIKGDETENLESYSNPDLPDDAEFLLAIRAFLLSV